MAKKNKNKAGRAYDDKNFPLPVYKKEDDIYSREKEEPLDDDENISKKSPVTKGRSLDDGLDIPGAELDDTDEVVGEEDEENNYYSLGGENHDDLEEDKT